MPTNTVYDSDADKQHDAEHLRAAEKEAEQARYDREFGNIAGNYGNTTEHPLGDNESSAPIVGNDLRGRADKQPKSASELKDGEEDAANNLNYTGKNNQKEVKINKGWWNKRKAKIAGGIAGAGTLGGLLGLTFLGGPLQFIHLAETLHANHLSQQEDASDGRMGKMFRYLSNNLDPGETRLGWIGSKYKTRILGQLKEIGVTFNTDPLTGYMKSATIDTTNEKSPYEGTNEEKKAAIASDYGVDVKDVHQFADGKFHITNVSSKYTIQKNILKTTIKAEGAGGVAAAGRTRVLKRYYGLSWSPLSRIQSAIHDKESAILKDKYKKYKEKWDNRIKKGVEPTTANGSQAKDDEGTDKNGNQKTGPASPEEQANINSSTEGASAKLSALKTTGKIAGGIGAAAGLACALKAVDDSVGQIKYAQVIIPMIRVGLEAIAVGDQVKSGQNVDPDELSYLSHYLSTTESNGKTSSWTDAMPIRENNGDTGGVDMNQGIKDTISREKLPWLDWTQQPPITQLCSTAGSIITGIVGGVVGVLSGGIVNTVAGFVISAIATGPIINYVSGLLAGDALNIDSLAGAAYGNVADYGAALGANAAALGMGAVQMTAKQLAEVNSTTQQEQKAEFDSQSFFARTFDLYDYRSLASIMLSGDTNSFTRNLATATTGVTHTLGSMLSLPLKLYASTVHAAPAPYQYPFATYGFSQEDLNNPAVENPYANADAAAKILDTNGQNGTPDYIQKAAYCFGVQIAKTTDDDGVARWDVIPNNDVNVYDTDNYDANSCIDSSDPNWLKIRFFILDTGTFEGYACAEFNDAGSCANDGEGNAATATSTGTTSNTPSGNSQDLAKQILANPNITLQKSCTTGADAIPSGCAYQDIQAASQGQKVTPGKIEGQSNGGASTGACSARTPEYLDATLLQGMLNIASKYKYTIQDIDSGHDCDSGRHPMGRAFDITAVNGVSVGGHCTDPDVYGFLKYVATTMSALMPNGSYPHEAGIGSCTSSTPSWIPTNINYFFDSSDEIHVDTGVPS